MHLEYTAEEKAFQQEVRDFLQLKLPEDIRQKVLNGLHLEKDDSVRWQKILFEQGWAAANWPVEHGGTGWTATQKHIWNTESTLAGAPEVVPFGMKMVAPVIFTYGNKAQQQRFLPDILASNVWWCQGYSEPNAGSDLASLKTTAVCDGDTYVVNGSKTWTTLAQHADWIFCLVRTGGPQVKNQEAISFLLIDMRSPGITLSPIYTLDGYHEVNEVHFDNVRVPVANRIGEEGKGWTYAKVLLTHERTNIARVAESRCRLEQAREVAAKTANGESKLVQDPAFAQKFAEAEIELMALEFTELRTLAAVSTGQAPGPESSILKIKGTEVAQLIDELHAEIAGYYGMPYLPNHGNAQKVSALSGPDTATSTSWLRYFNHRKTSIYGGSNEIQKNIICKAVLGL